MSTSVYPPPGSIKSIQRGVLNVSANASASVTISAVNTAKTVESFLGVNTAGGNYGCNMVLSNATTITADNTGNASGAKISWVLKEEY